MAGLAKEADDLLSSPRWRLVLTSSTVAHHVHAAAGLRHVVALLEDVASAVARRRETAIRILGRAHLEAWLVALYVTVYGDDALADIQAGYTKAISSQHTRLAEYDESLKREIAKINDQNQRIQDRNRDLQRWNEAHPGGLSKPLTDEMPLPRRTAVALDLIAAIDDGPADDDQPPPLPLAAIVARLNEYGRAQEGPDVELVRQVTSNAGAPGAGAHAELTRRSIEMTVRNTEALNLLRKETAAQAREWRNSPERSSGPRSAWSSSRS